MVLLYYKKISRRDVHCLLLKMHCGDSETNRRDVISVGIWKNFKNQKIKQLKKMNE